MLEGLRAAWAFFEGVSQYLVLDNFPAAVAGADRLHPRLTRGFLEYAQQRGLIADPTRPRQPREKPRVERSVPCVRERFFKGTQFRDLAEMRAAARRWCLEVAGQRVEVRLGAKLVHIYQRGQLIKIHPRQGRGGRSTDPNDYPAELSAYTTRAPDQVQRRVADLGPAVAVFAERLFEGPVPWSKLRQGHKLLRLGERYSAERLDAACRRALEVELIDVRRVERILAEALEQQTTPAQPPPLPPGRFTRPGSVFAQRRPAYPADHDGGSS